MDSLMDELWNLLWDEVEGPEDYPNARPLLAHYTSAVTAEAILRGKELWLSHPILMNDVEELQWGIREAIKILSTHKGVETACGSYDRFDRFINLFQEHVDLYDHGHARSLFAACFSMHEEGDGDGILSMWRAYGSNGEGVAIVFDTAKITPQDDSPFILGPVKYCLPGEREALIRKEIEKIADFFLRKLSEIGDKKMGLSASYLLEKIKFISLTTKHCGFKEENEWRLIYFSERDSENLFENYVDYAAGVTGFQPKLKIPLDGRVSWIPNLSDLIAEIILGPSHGSVLAINAFERMLDKSDLGSVKSRVRRSTIPFRSRGF